MANLLDYLDWRGDLTLEQAGFNEVDNLILAELSFLDFGGIVPPPGKGKPVPLFRAAQAYFDRVPEGEKVYMGILVPKEIPEMLRRMAKSPRFREMKLAGFSDHFDEKRAEQFAAVTVLCGDGTAYLSYRGTDDTLAGWKESLYLGCMHKLPSQVKAVDYVTQMARQFPRMKLQLGGHSKGGNLAIWAGVFCPPAQQRRIRAIWSNDGPGFFDDLSCLPQHKRVAECIRTIVPKASVVGLLLEHEKHYTVVDSSQQGLFQHDGFSWEVRGSRFVSMKSVTAQARAADREVRRWAGGLTEQQRSQVVESVFQVLEATGAKTLTDLMKNDTIKTGKALVKAISELDKDSRDAVWKVMSLLLLTNLRLTVEGLQEGAGNLFSKGRQNGAAP